MGDCPLTHSGDSRLYLEKFPSAAVFFLIIHFYFQLSWVFNALRGLSIAAVRGCFALQWLLLLQSVSSRAHRLQQLRLLGSKAQAQQVCLVCSSQA